MKFVCQNKNLLELVLRFSRAFKRFGLLHMRITVYSETLQNYEFDNFSFINCTFHTIFSIDCGNNKDSMGVNRF